jgi:hypothetical protein
MMTSRLMTCQEIKSLDVQLNSSRIKALQRLDDCGPSFAEKFEKTEKTLDKTANIW